VLVLNARDREFEAYFRLDGYCSASSQKVLWSRGYYKSTTRMPAVKCIWNFTSISMPVVKCIKKFTSISWILLSLGVCVLLQLYLLILLLSRCAATFSLRLLAVFARAFAQYLSFSFRTTCNFVHIFSSIANYSCWSSRSTSAIDDLDTFRRSLAVCLYLRESGKCLLNMLLRFAQISKLLGCSFHCR